MRNTSAATKRRQVLECASPLALSTGLNAEVWLGKATEGCRTSGRFAFAIHHLPSLNFVLSFSTSVVSAHQLFEFFQSLL
jgi:hypothetical protein